MSKSQIIPTNIEYTEHNLKIIQDFLHRTETYNGDLGVIVKTLSEVSENEMQNLPTIMYEVQVGPTTEYWMGISLKKIKNKKKFDK